jgi:hypothetical protein
MKNATLQRNSAVMAVVLVAALVLPGCTPEITASEAAAITRDAAALFGEGCSSREIAPTNWPSSIAALEPDSVSMRAGGLFIATTRLFVEEWGLFLPCDAAAFNPAAGSDPTYTKVSDALYLYHVAG